MNKYHFHVISALIHSQQGFLRLLKEKAFKDEILGYAAGIIFIIFNSGTFKNYLFFTILALALFAVEAINTAIEEIIDHLSPERSIVGKNAKDLGSFACFLIILANVLYLVGVAVKI
ncbi:Diacylglycerol kinase [Liberibacter crescens BT-1]|uniref:Diacylglycerol kinase n=1 Tax=Liberibacter crescens (strain BT-1) TaxID=1215343 RepID=L0EX59_LIBCB|nr:diacylglycerol kinase [Liberibacter crescens]AGA65248.1 Diacylglycerol kinase [Liberibacter crescens BT-1]AMC13187.1 hypothetical protein RL73_06340 [Liberibacter crescens]